MQNHPSHDEWQALQHKFEMLEAQLLQRRRSFRAWRMGLSSCALFLLLGGIGFLAAGGYPSTNPLVYSGYLEKGGKPLNGSYPVDYTLYAPNDSTATTCKGSSPSITFIKGRFKLPLTQTDCVDVLKKHTEVWIGLMVDKQTLSKQKISASPYVVSSKLSCYTLTQQSDKPLDTNAQKSSTHTGLTLHCKSGYIATGGGIDIVSAKGSKADTKVIYNIGLNSTSGQNYWQCGVNQKNSPFICRVSCCKVD
ncbi:MAG: hypothetical protein EP343_11230 [Deltaproteobacteria bacterium]|nr:MAG: hypothetical protein EP343_11230 [Deltaproteobacteria bacterium]